MFDFHGITRGVMKTAAQGDLNRKKKTQRAVLLNVR